MRMREVIVHWLDATSEDSQLEINGAKDLTIYEVSTRGLLLDENERQVILAMEEYTSPNSPTVDRHITAIPRIAITEIK